MYLLLCFGYSVVLFFLTIFASFEVLRQYKKLFPKQDKHDTNIYAKTEEEIYDSGFVEDMEMYEDRIKEMKQSLEEGRIVDMPHPMQSEPAIEFMTDEQEASREVR